MCSPPSFPRASVRRFRGAGAGASQVAVIAPSSVPVPPAPGPHRLAGASTPEPWQVFEEQRNLPCALHAHDPGPTARSVLRRPSAFHSMRLRRACTGSGYGYAERPSVCGATRNNYGVQTIKLCSGQNEFRHARNSIPNCRLPRLSITHRIASGSLLRHLPANLTYAKTGEARVGQVRTEEFCGTHVRQVARGQPRSSTEDGWDSAAKKESGNSQLE
ncbi:hypothetical protein FB451DRAFT_62108 [Mycena latifolia]|nr:hypothetical protein FB451DRAFT_62108 [Mycena latifolia]